ncbi:uncharacterized protein SAZU_6974 [Streptomyces azureus]|uniref:Uncharacterized protein n=1 Tax=Streptomyces azureus TaxID=146537 RepID=A0A0K8PWD5_STRAJ|nr:uncharacterized protein SAZU_6974 [Streptomyces azureus]
MPAPISPAENASALPPTSAALSAPDLEQLLALQRRTDEKLVPRQKDSEIQQPSDLFYFPDLITTTHLIKLSWPVGRALVPSDALAAAIDAHAAPVVSAITARDSGSAALTLKGSRDAPPDAMACGALLLAADNLLADRDRRTMAERIEPIAFEAFHRAKTYTKRLLNDGGISPNLAVATSTRAPGFRMLGRLRDSPYSYRFTVDEVPPYLPLDWFSDHFTDLRTQLPDATYRDDRLIRRGASLRLANWSQGSRGRSVRKCWTSATAWGDTRATRWAADSPRTDWGRPSPEPSIKSPSDSSSRPIGRTMPTDAAEWHVGAWATPTGPAS